MNVCLTCGEKTNDLVTHVNAKHPVTCEEMKKLFANHFEGNLSRKHEERVSCHRAKCKPCNDEFATYAYSRQAGIDPDLSVEDLAGLA